VLVLFFIQRLLKSVIHVIIYGLLSSASAHCIMIEESILRMGLHVEQVIQVKCMLG
jgi:hypothetical protein